jgi:pilus assembly protein CpaE
VALDNALVTDALNRAILPAEVDSRARFNKDLKKMFKERLDDAAR